MGSPMTKRVLIVDDEPDIRELLEITLGRMQLSTDTAKTVQEAKDKLNSQEFQLCLTDMRLPDGNGLELVEHIQHRYAGLPVAVITAHGSIDTAIDSMKAGAFDFLTKPVDLNHLRKLVTTAIQTAQIVQPVTPKTTAIIGQSSIIEDLIKNIHKLSRSQAPVYISGESGSGKELVARSIHELGSRSSKPFVAVNCGAIPRELMESEFFGHKKGSFTGAHQDKIGLFQAAEGGTLFFDEVADLPLEMQVKLLRAIQEKTIRPVGASEEITTDVRILCATHKLLDLEVKEGRFRQDLFYRLNVIQLAVPPLRERREDILLLADYVLHKIASSIGSKKPELTSDAKQKLESYQFPGNVRELENILERAFTLCESNRIDANDLVLNNQNYDLNEKPIGSSLSSLKSFQTNDVNYPDLCSAFPSIDDYLQQVEKTILLNALEKSRWNKTLTAKKLGITFRSLRYRLQKLGLDDE
jgi:two-component system, NtrC family, response regulator PilR